MLWQHYYATAFGFMTVHFPLLVFLVVIVRWIFVFGSHADDRFLLLWQNGFRAIEHRHVQRVYATWAR